MTNGWLKRREGRVRVKRMRGGVVMRKRLRNEMLVRSLFSSSWTASADCEFPVVLVVQCLRQTSDNDSYYRTICPAKEIQAIPSGYREWQRIQTVIYWEEGGTGHKYVPLNTLCVLAEWCPRGRLTLSASLVRHAWEIFNTTVNMKYFVSHWTTNLIYSESNHQLPVQSASRLWKDSN